MELYPRLFIKAALIYLIIGTFLGFSYSFNFLEPLRFAHVHLNLFGFMAMFIFGIAYHVIPRFNATKIKNQELVRVHFYLSNAGLIGMVFLHPVEPSFSYTFFLMTGLVSVWLFVYILFPLLNDKESETIEHERSSETVAKSKTETKTVSSSKITGEMLVRDVLSQYPEKLDIFINAGLKGLANKEHRDNLPPVQIHMAAAKHGVDINKLLSELNNPMSGDKKPFEINKNTLIGDLMEKHPEVKELFEKEYGASCFTCPSYKTETIEQTALMHNRNVDEILLLINKTIANAGS
ncbi:MAG: DUF1858 domain-containing protein [Nitrospinae bacterium]|nr:DUF1858 domain-containing protein [Nitrospinota bacterium]